ncbi:prematurely terminated mRNA decay factor-like [Ectocarpus siliculosus]|uniref:Prematurely terminated mRNA decay factor-like n=1 Tax=Ectocarpus siliculosus TaxID=2880 RepID=D8LH01_ECTSI|nr:prematurely terminated mRNA decay factor-like [Ectocarpus siliculosus]|eukprot:CBN75854.1 prematurely terminated mRNA decay factor-like [Ectocarpus siliculosus]
MLSVGPLGDDSEALRLEAMAGGGASGGGSGGGGSSSSNARSIHAIRCFNAQTHLSAVDLLRNGRLGDDDGDDDGNGKALATATGSTETRPVFSGAVRPGSAPLRAPVTMATTEATTTTRTVQELERETRRRRRRTKSRAVRRRREEGGWQERTAPRLFSCTACSVALCVMVDRIATEDARLRPSRGLPPRPKAEQIRVLLASGTNVAVDRVLMGLVSAGFDDIARLGSHRRTHKSLLDRVVHSSPPGRDAQKAVQSELQAMLKTAVGADRDEIGRALQASKAESFTTDQTKRLREARVTGVTCASATVPLLTRPPRSPRPLPRGGVVSGGNGSNGSVAARKTGVATGGTKTAGPWKRPAGVAGSNGRLLGGGRGSAGARGWSGGGGDGGRRGYDIVVLDESSQIVEPMSLLPVAVAQPRRLVLVGDPMQLPPPVARARSTVSAEHHQNQQQEQEQHHHHHQQSQRQMPKDAWLEKANARPGNGDTLEKTLFVRLAKLGVKPLLLGRQYRCHPQMSALASRLFYQGRLTDGVAARDRGPLVSGLAPLTLLDAAGRGAESTAPGGSIKNAFEARAVADVVASLLRAGSSGGGGGGGVGGGDKAQLAQVRRELESASCATPGAASIPSSSSSPDDGVQPGGEGRDEGQQGGASSVSSCCRDVQVSTVDAFQGAEKDIVIVASTRTERLGFIVR